ncbi:hypothetical protein F5X97DRAFT_341172 [Nemania serpens]|nr:hypothetical protein F5X97DRAFT_341172 [Nemania serpens]
MPPKRKQSDDILSGSESDIVLVSPRRPAATTLLPEVMQNIERLKTKRGNGRKKIAAGFKAYIDGMKNEIEDHYTTEDKKRSTEVKTLLTRYAEALEKRASIEKSIEEIVLNSREDLRELTIVLEAAYSGRQQQSTAAAGSFASIGSVPAKTSTTHLQSPTDNGTVDMQSKAWSNKAGKENRTPDGNPAYARGSKPWNEQRGGSVFDQFSW